MKPEPSELVLRGCRSPFLSPPLEPPPGPRRFLKKSSKNSSNGEPGGSCGIVPLPSPPLASMVCEVEMFTTASITFSATSAMPSGPRASAGAEIRTLAAPRQIAANQGLSRRLKAGIARVMFALSLQKKGRELKSTVRPNRVAAQAFELDSGGKTGFRASLIVPLRIRRKTRAIAHHRVDPAAFSGGIRNPINHDLFLENRFPLFPI